MNNKNIYFKNIDGIGNLYLNDVFLDFENEPILFTLSDENSNLYFSWCPEIRYEQIWYILKCKKQLYRNLINNHISVLQFIKKHTDIIKVKLSLDGKEVYEKTNVNSIKDYYLPEEDLYLDLSNKPIIRHNLNEFLLQYSLNYKLLSDKNKLIYAEQSKFNEGINYFKAGELFIEKFLPQKNNVYSPDNTVYYNNIDGKNKKVNFVYKNKIYNGNDNILYNIDIDTEIDIAA